MHAHGEIGVDRADARVLDGGADAVPESAADQHALERDVSVPATRHALAHPGAARRCPQARARAVFIARGS